MEVTGKLIEKVYSGEVKKVDGTVVKKRDGTNLYKTVFVIQQKDVKYENKIRFSSLNNDVIRFINDTQIGTDIDVSFQPTSREWNGKWFDEIRAFRVEVNRQVESPVLNPKDIDKTQELAQIHGLQHSRATTVSGDDPSNDLPF